jgi:SAM-dependent methyltransferase
MSDAREETLAALDTLRESCAAAAEAFLAARGADVEAYRNLVSQGIKDALSRMRAEMDDLAAGSPVVHELGEQASAYVDWMQWCLWDLPVLAVALESEADTFRSAVMACGIVYISIRIFDDFIDQHYSYKGRHDTLLATVSTTYPDLQKAAGLNTLAGLLLCFQGLQALTEAGLTATVHEVVGAVRRAVVGAIMEFDELHQWTPAQYQRLVKLKNVDYWRVLYAGLDPTCSSPLHPFLEQYYELAQYLNDVDDYEDDARWGQPNLLAIHQAADPVAARCAAIDDIPSWPIPGKTEQFIAERFLRLAEMLAKLKGTERSVAEYQLSLSLQTAYRLGLFSPKPSPPPKVLAPHPRLFWYSDMDDLVTCKGPQSIVAVDCGACGSAERRQLFRKQGFAYHRCRNCGHVYVSPRITTEAQSEILLGADGLGCDDMYLDVQRMSAEYVCNLLRMQAAGPRLLDIGFGRGYMLQMAQVYGFEVHGVDGSPAAVERLRPQFGRRVAHGVIGVDPIPWDSFDVVVMSHVLEHLASPAEAIADVASRMNRRALLYLVVPDIESAHFRIFGKHWDAISPLAHLHYWSQSSLSRVLERSGLGDIQRIYHPQMREEVAPRWVRLMNRLGGSESSELAILAWLQDPVTGSA